MSGIESIPPRLDHIVLGSSDLNRGMDFIEKATGVRAAFGGVHAGRGTCNALLSLGKGKYLEIMAPDPAQARLTWFHSLPKLQHPCLVGWVVRTDDMRDVAERFQSHGIEFDIQEGSRTHQDGRVLQWEKLDLRDDVGGLLPSFIEWNADTVHPSIDAPSGCRLVSLYLVTNNNKSISRIRQIAGIELFVQAGPRACLKAQIAGPKGTVDLMSS